MVIAGLILYTALYVLIVWIDRCIKKWDREERDKLEERGRRLRYRPYNIVAEAEVVLARLQRQQKTTE